MIFIGKNRVDLKGERFGRLLVIEESDPIIYESGHKERMWRCKCDCGNETVVRHGCLQRGHTTSCGCYHKEKFGDINRTHNLSYKSSLYNVWKNMKDRCYRKKCKSYKNYGARGITVCDEWKNDYKKFYDWAIENGYNEEKTEAGLNVLTIDRIDVNGNYEPRNCRFVTNSEQAKNKRKTIGKEERFKICPICGREYAVTQRNGAKTCSPKCGAELRKRNYPNTKNYTKICPVCGKEYSAKRGGHFNQAVYCSRECKNLSESPIWELNGESHRVVEWAEITGINAHCLLHRKELGWDIERILTTPKRKVNRGEKNNNS